MFEFCNLSKHLHKTNATLHIHVSTLMCSITTPGVTHSYKRVSSMKKCSTFCVLVARTVYAFKSGGSE